MIIMIVGITVTNMTVLIIILVAIRIHILAIIRILITNKNLKRRLYRGLYKVV